MRCGDRWGGGELGGRVGGGEGGGGGGGEGEGGRGNLASRRDNFTGNLFGSRRGRETQFSLWGNRSVRGEINTSLVPLWGRIGKKKVNRVQRRGGGAEG